MPQTGGDVTVVGFGTIDFDDDFIVVTSDLGTLSEEVIVSETISNIALSVFARSEATVPLPQSNETVTVDCCNTPFTLCLEFKHTLNKIKLLNSFIQSNNLFLPGVIRKGSSNTDFIKLNYSARNQQWRGNLHFEGVSSQNNIFETWDIVVVFACVNSLWQFALTITSAQSGNRNTSKLILTYATDDICTDSQAFFGFNFSLDTNSLIISPSSLQPVVLNDDAGIFRDLQLKFSLFAQNGVASHQSPVDNSIAYASSLGIK